MVTEITALSQSTQDMIEAVTPNSIGSLAMTQTELLISPSHVSAGSVWSKCIEEMYYGIETVYSDSGNYVQFPNMSYKLPNVQAISHANPILNLTNPLLNAKTNVTITTSLGGNLSNVNFEYIVDVCSQIENNPAFGEITDISDPIGAQFQFRFVSLAENPNIGVELTIYNPEVLFGTESGTIKALKDSGGDVYLPEWGFNGIGILSVGYIDVANENGEVFSAPYCADDWSAKAYEIYTVTTIYNTELDFSSFFLPNENYDPMAYENLPIKQGSVTSLLNNYFDLVDETKEELAAADAELTTALASCNEGEEGSADCTSAATLQTYVDTLRLDIATLEEEEVQVSAISSALDEIDGADTSYTSDEDMGAINTQLLDIQAQITGRDAEIAGLEAQIEEQTETYGSSLSDLTQQLSDANADIAEAEIAKGEVELEIANTDESNTAAIDALNDEAIELNDTISGHLTSITVFENDIAELEADLLEEEGITTGLNDDISDLNADISDLNAAKDDVEAQLAEAIAQGETDLESYTEELDGINVELVDMTALKVEAVAELANLVADNLVTDAANAAALLAKNDEIATLELEAVDLAFEISELEAEELVLTQTIADNDALIEEQRLAGEELDQTILDNIETAQAAWDLVEEARVAAVQATADVSAELATAQQEKAAVVTELAELVSSTDTIIADLNEDIAAKVLQNETDATTILELEESKLEVEQANAALIIDVSNLEATVIEAETAITNTMGNYDTLADLLDSEISTLTTYLGNYGYTDEFAGNFSGDGKGSELSNFQLAVSQAGTLRRQYLNFIGSQEEIQQIQAAKPAPSKRRNATRKAYSNASGDNESQSPLVTIGLIGAALYFGSKFLKK